jgi:EAL domain-containing protein (putative c-di-GMP-specific phosphodiesterase class I)
MANDQSTRWILWSRESAAAEPDSSRQSFAPASQPAGSAQPAPAEHLPGSRSLPPAELELIQKIVKERRVTIQFQPIKDVSRSQIVGFEALTRGPAGRLERPDRLFAAAAAAGLAGQLDWVCRAVAFREMLVQDLPPSISLFVNVEPDSLIEACPEDLLETIWQASTRLRVFIDITGRALTRYPTQVLETVRRARAAGWGVAVGDIEFSSSGLALLPTLEPDVLKMNHKAVTSGAGPADHAVRAALGETEQTGAVVMLERIEDDSGVQVGRSIGAIYQLGYRHGAPGALPSRLSVPLAPVPLREGRAATPEAPWDVLARNGAHISSGVQADGVAYLLRVFANEAADDPLPPVIAFVAPDNMLPSNQASEIFYTMLLQRCPLVLMAGRDVRSMSDWHVRTGDLPVGHRLLNQFCFAALSPTLSMALVARPDPHRPGIVDIAVTHQPAICRSLVRNLIDVLDTLEGGIRHAISS